MSGRNFEPVLATAASGATAATAAASAHDWIQLAVAIATLAWWIRLWIKNPNLPPPGASKGKE